MEYSIEPELQHSPRQVRRRGTRGFGTLFSQWLIVPPLVALTFLMLLWCAHMVAVRVAGPTVPCRIVERYEEYDREERETRHYLVYRYEVAGRPYTERELVEESVYAKQPLQSALNVRVSPVWPGHDSVLLAPGRDLWSGIGFFSFATVFMILGTAALGWFVYSLPIKRRQLAKTGVPVRGVLTDKSKYESSRAQSYSFHYQYQPQGSEETLSGSQNVRRSDWDAPSIGDIFTVLYEPQNPQFSVLYPYGDYRAL